MCFSVAIPILVLNAIIADSVEYMTKEIQTALKKRPSDDRDVVIAVRRFITIM